MLDAGAVAVGSPTLNVGMMPTVAGFLTYMQGLKPRNIFGAAFGSHGWGGGGAAAVDAWLDKIGIEKIRGPVTCVYKPESGVLDECKKLGAELADAAAARCR
jgi:flavorubredoxin